MSASPCTAKPLDDDDPEHGLSDAEQERGPAQVRDGGVLDHHLKRSKVYDLEYLDENGDHPIVIADDEYGNDQVYYDNNGAYSGGRLDDRLYDDVTSNQADDEDSIVEVYGGSPGLSNSSSSFGDATVRRAASPAASHASGDSNTTITPNRIRLAESQARASDSRLESSTASRPRSSATPTTSLEQERAAHRTPTRVNDPNVEEVIEVIDLTRPERRTNYPRGDSLPRVPGLSPQHSFNLPTLQRLVSRSSESMERSQPRRANNSNSSIDVHEIPDDDDEAENDQDDDRFGSNTVRIDSDVHEVQLDPHHPWARGPIQLILSPERSEEDQYLEGQRQRQLEDAIVVDDHLTQIDYEDIESDSELEDLQVQENAEVEDDGVTAQQVDQECVRKRRIDSGCIHNSISIPKDTQVSARDGGGGGYFRELGEAESSVQYLYGGDGGADDGAMWPCVLSRMYLASAGFSKDLSDVSVSYDEEQTAGTGVL
ncbi:hypothetical protein BGZ58_004321 [Dissophora ornata]|nr:hypothetical protein BGZ58_004321 [Dissophora ornata]